MKKLISKVYEGYPEQPFISEDRDLADWEQFPEKYPYAKVEIKQMKRLEEDLLPGDIIMLWRIGFDNFTNESVIPAYFEYRYGINHLESQQRLKDLGYMYEGSVLQTLPLISTPVLKRLLKENGLSQAGKKAEILQRVIDNIELKQLEAAISLRRFVITESGRALLEKYHDIIKRHGPKQM